MHERRKRMVVVAVVLALSATFGSGCGRGLRHFTHVDRMKYSSQIHDIQYYVSEDAVFSRMMESYEEGVAPDHTIRTLQQYRIEEMAIGERTPGILVGERGDTLLVSFEPPVAGRERYFRFIHQKDHYCLEIPFRPGENQLSGYCVPYAGKCYFLGTVAIGERGPQAATSNCPCLLVASDAFEDVDRDVHILEGRELD
ncbi:MAG: hypothetical protein GF330_07305 [Candidatus Eisenbacteria bacterium]|nr:hypothetical protein [Candidatus Eisenbacteria bacterium]